MHHIGLQTNLLFIIYIIQLFNFYAVYIKISLVCEWLQNNFFYLSLRQIL